MDTISLLEQLAQIPYDQDKINFLTSNFSAEIKLAFLENDSQRLRQLISGQYCFPDSKVVAQV